MADRARQQQRELQQVARNVDAPPGNQSPSSSRGRRSKCSVSLSCILLTFAAVLLLKLLMPRPSDRPAAGQRDLGDESSVSPLFSEEEFPQLDNLFATKRPEHSLPNDAVSFTFYGDYDIVVSAISPPSPLDVAAAAAAAATPSFTSDITAPMVTFLREGGNALRVSTDPTGGTAKPGEVLSQESGRVRMLLLSRPSVMPDVRLAVARLEFEPAGAPMRVMRLSGLDLRNIASVTLQGVARPRALKVNKSQLLLSRSKNPDAAEFDLCHVVGSFRMRKWLAASSARDVTLRPLDTVGTRWGLDDSEFGLGGTWDARRRRQLREENNDEEGDDHSEEIGGDIWGSLVSADCGVRVWLKAKEVDLSKLTTAVVGFVVLFVAKSLGEMRAFFAQVRHAEWPGSPLKMSYASLALHVCVDCFDVIVLLGQAASSNFMASAFVLLAVLKLLFVSAVQLRFLVLVVRARLSAEGEGAGLTARLSRFVKLHAAGTALLLIGALEGLSLWPGCLAMLFFFWVPQIALDAAAGNRKALSLEYLIGMSLCRLVLPLYLWGYGGSIFDGRVLRQPPGAPALWLCGLLTSLVGVQVAMAVAQQQLGPRWFIPRGCLPGQYDYYRPLPTPIGASPPAECVICMSEIDPNKRPRTIAVTPCNHLFHDACLQRWLDVKPECPTCRGPLPPFI